MVVCWRLLTAYRPSQDAQSLWRGSFGKRDAGESWSLSATAGPQVIFGIVPAREQFGTRDHQCAADSNAASFQGISV